MYPVDRTSALPIYFQVALDLRRRLTSGEWRVGQRIAPELSLAREYDVSRVTIRQALAELVKDDLVERHRGSGTYVREQQRPLAHDLRLNVNTLAARLRDQGFENRAEVIEAGLLREPADDLRARLQLAPDATAVYMVRRIVINGEPAALARSWFDADKVPGLERSPGLRRSLSAVLEEEYGLAPVRSDNQIEVVRSTRDEAALLHATADTPLFVVTTTTYLDDGRPLELSRKEWLGDRVRFHVTSHPD